MRDCLPWDVKSDGFVHELYSVMFGSGVKMYKKNWRGGSNLSWKQCD